MQTDLFQRVHHYCLLNASFSDDIGMRSGKTALLLFYGQRGLLPGNPLQEHFVYSYLDELSGQISKYTPLDFGDGIAGLGVVLKHLQNQGVLDIDLNELLEETDQYILSLVFRGNLSNVSLFSGLSGIGLYLISRVQEREFTTSFKEMAFRESVISILDHISTCLEPMLASEHDARDTGLSKGLAGVLLFINAVDELQWYHPLSGKLKTAICNYCLTQLMKVTATSPAAETWFVLLYCSTKEENAELAEKIFRGVSLWLEMPADKPDTATLPQMAFQAMWLQLIFHRTGIQKAGDWSERLLQVVESSLADGSLPLLFPYSQNKKSVALGLEDGILGAVLPVWSIQMRTYEWLEIFGFSGIGECLASENCYQPVMQTDVQ